MLPFEHDLVQKVKKAVSPRNLIDAHHSGIYIIES